MKKASLTGDAFFFALTVARLPFVAAAGEDEPMPSEPDTDPQDDLPDWRDESAPTRADRTGNEVLQELRVMQTGTQILTGFLLALVFQPAFSQRAKTEVVSYGHAALVTVSVLVVGVVGFVFDVLVDGAAAIVTVIVLTPVILTLWVAAPLTIRARLTNGVHR